MKNRKRASLRWLARKRSGPIFAVAWAFKASDGRDAYRGTLTQASCGWRAIGQTLYTIPDYARANLTSIDATELHCLNGALCFPDGSPVLGWAH